MITAITIENLRGIAEGRLAGLAPLTIITGPNGCGKSTVLDAMLIAASPTPGEAIGRAVDRHPVARDGARWLVRRGLDGNSSRLAIEFAGAPAHECFLAVVRLPPPARHPDFDDPPDATFMVGYFAGSRARDDAQGAAMGKTAGTAMGDQTRVRVKFSARNASRTEHVSESSPLPTTNIRLIDPGLPIALAESFSEAIRAGARREIETYLPFVAPSARSLEILSDKGVPSLYVDSEVGGPIPAALAGDGVQSFLQLAIELAQVPHGLALVEEPEVYQHPRALRQTALALVAAMRRGVQVVMTTHSLELIDAIIATLSEDEQGNLAFFSLMLEGGVLKSSRFGGADAAFARTTIERDLR